MRRRFKTQLIEIVDALTEANSELEQTAGQSGELLSPNALAEEQDALIAVGSQIEESEGEGTEAVSLLENCCEVLWWMSQSEDAPEQRKLLGQLTEILACVRTEIEGFEEQYIAVFLPYKASMWDCMESVWKAACEDPACQPFVVPVPYFDMKDGQVKERHYEGGKLPEYVPITDYRTFSFEDICPEMAYVHNPYDENNLVTRLPEETFSGQLKQYVQRLVYIPYYVTGEAVFMTHRYLPSYQNYDFIVTQCEKMIESYESSIPKEKFLPYGSPIADRIIFMAEHQPQIPQEWMPMLPNGKDFGGKRTVMLNTSLSLLLKQRERFLDKLEYIFKLAKETEGILIVWRPHPLLQATAEMMGEEIKERLRKLEEYFLREKIGVLDKNLDVGVTVALCDAYLGETASSMIHMFGIAGKPRFYINLIIPKEGKASAGFQNKICRMENGNYSCEISCKCTVEGKEYFILNEYGWIVEKDPGSGETLPLVAIPGFEIYRENAYRCMEGIGEELVVYPERAEGIFYYNLRNGQMRKIFDKSLEENLRKQKAGPENAFEEVNENVIASIRAALFKKDNLDHTWYEDDERTLRDFFYFLQTAEDKELSGYTGQYQQWLATMDGTCGEKVYRAVKRSIADAAE